MSLAEFQRALADLVASPTLRAVAGVDPTAALASYDLDRREHARLAVMVRHPGMSANFAVYQAHRTDAVVAALPNTCAALGDRMDAMLDRFWSLAPAARTQDLAEARAFARFVRVQQAESGVIEAKVILALRADLAALGSGDGEIRGRSSRS